MKTLKRVKMPTVKKKIYEVGSERSYAVGVMGLGLDDFLDLTPFEFMEVKQQFNEHQNDLFRNEWEKTRWLAFRTAYPPQPKGRKEVRATDFVVFPWEREEFEKSKPKKADPKYVAKLIERYK